MSYHKLVAIYPALLIFLVGCWSDGAPTTYPVTGIVTYKGKPVEGATVTLVPSQAEGRSASGVTNAEGAFEVSTYVSPKLQPVGALPGDYAVTVSKMEVRQVDESLSPQEAQAAFAKLGPPKNLLPKKYRLPNTSDFSIKIEDAAPQPLTLDLKD